MVGEAEAVRLMIFQHDRPFEGMAAVILTEVRIDVEMIAHEQNVIGRPLLNCRSTGYSVDEVPRVLILARKKREAYLHHDTVWTEYRSETFFLLL